MRLKCPFCGQPCGSSWICIECDTEGIPYFRGGLLNDKCPSCGTKNRKIRCIICGKISRIEDWFLFRYKISQS